MKKYIGYMFFLIGLPLLVGCQKEASDTAAAAPQAQHEKAESKTFEVKVESPKSGKVGEPVATRVGVEPRGEYKVNVEYPAKLVVKAPASAIPSEMTLTVKEAKKLTTALLLFEPVFKLSKPGEYAFEGDLRFSVCTKKQCEIKSEKVKWVTSVQ